MSTRSPSVRPSARNASPRTLGLVAVLAAAFLAVPGCEPAAQDAADGEAGAAQQAAAAVTAEEFVQWERGLWEALEGGDHEGFLGRLADDMILVGGEGVMTKQDLADLLEGSDVEAYEIGDFQVMRPGSNVAAVTYRYSETFRPADAESSVTFAGWATSIWENRDGVWLTVFHQSSEAPPTE